MKIYLAARYSRYPEMQQVAQRLRALGHSVTSRWIQGTHQYRGDETPEQKLALRRRWAEIDFADLIQAELLLSFTEDESTLPPESRSRGGRHVKFGIAMGRMLRLWIVGPRKNVFHCIDDVRQFDTLDQALAALSVE